MGRVNEKPVYIRKSFLMIGSFLLLWIISLIFFGPLLLSLIAASRTAIEFVLLLSYSAILVIFWLIAAYCIAMAIFSFTSKPLPHKDSNSEWPVAILYTTYNDFQPDAAMSCLKQDYPNFHLFLLDDSTKKEYQEAVDAFHGAHPNKTTIVRRKNRTGFKAGHLNYALRKVANRYPFFTVVDADEKLPNDFLQKAVPYFQESDIAFVQANHEPNPDQNSSFAKDISPTILPLWHLYRSRNNYGFVVFLGHGAMVRSSAWKAVGGFPEVVTEDLAFSVALGEKGMRGVFVEDIVCHEDFAENYTAFKKQQERYFIGTTQVTKTYLGPLLRSRNISVTEKIDAVMWCSLMYLPALVLLFIVLSVIGIAAVFGHWETISLSVMGQDFVLPAITIGKPFEIFSSPSFQLFSVLCVLSPTFPAIILGLKKRFNAVKLLFLNTAPYFSLMVVSWSGILGYLLMGRVTWGGPTGDTTLHGNNSNSLSNSLSDKKRKEKSWRSLIHLEIVIGSILVMASLLSFNLALFAVSSCLLIGVGIQRFGWKNKIVRTASVVCFTIILLQIFINVLSPFQSKVIMPFPLPVHL